MDLTWKKKKICYWTPKGHSLNPTSGKLTAQSSSSAIGADRSYLIYTNIATQSGFVSSWFKKPSISVCAVAAAYTSSNLLHLETPQLPQEKKYIQRFLSLSSHRNAAWFVFFLPLNPVQVCYFSDTLHFLFTPLSVISSLCALWSSKWDYR